MSKSALTGRADLVRLIGQSVGQHVPQLAYLFGYQADSRPRPEAPQPTPVPTGEFLSEKAPSHTILDAPSTPVSFWRSEHFALVSDRKMDARIDRQPATYPGWRARPTIAAPFQPLVLWRELAVRLRHALGVAGDGQAIDVDQVVARISEGEVLTRLPRTPLFRWCGRLQVVFDRSRRLIPYFDDQRYVAVHLRHLLADSDFLPAMKGDGNAALCSFARNGEEIDYQWPPTGSAVLVLGDLGTMVEAGDSAQFWLEFGRRLRARGCRPVALFPGFLGRCPAEMAAVWNLVSWEQAPRITVPKSGEEPVIQLLRLVSPALRIEPGLLRAVRRLLPVGIADAGVEAEVWQHPWLESASPAGAMILAKYQLPLRQEFAERTPLLLRREVARTLRSWRAELPEEIWFRELLSMDPAAQEAVLTADLEDARQYERAFCNEMTTTPQHGQDLAWHEWSAAVATSHFWNDPELGRQLVQLHHHLNRERTDYHLPPGVSPDQIEPAFEDQLIEGWVTQVGQHLHLERTATGLGTLLTQIRSVNGLLAVRTFDEKESNAVVDDLPFWSGDDNAPIWSGDDSAPIWKSRNAHSKGDPFFWKSGTPPTWADTWGWDKYGAWVEFVVKEVRQRMRWIPPGSFMMGSPKNEHNRYNNEGPQHRVTFPSGFWICDTACTQALWQVVMGKNPSRFQSPDRPVEQVDFADVRHFFENMEKLLPGLGLGLPSEAQWEYACRAGTTTPFSFGPTISTAQVNFDGNFPYLPGDAKGEYRGETVPVASLPPNPWGLFEMHGNVWEWCQDTWHGSYKDAPTDGRSWVDEAGARRVVRGGSWLSHARLVRAACRDVDGPSLRNDDLGFRCARVQPSQASQQEEAEPLSARPGRLAERRTERAESGSALLLDLRKSPDKASCLLPAGEHFQIQSDCEILTFGRLVKPAWADAIGRDRYGLWAEFMVGAVRQRMRWIPPGRFMMGSPEGEEGRFKNEGPQHEVNLPSGFWLFDTPCTQALWQVVMGKNPSRFQLPDRPVEQVSFNDAQKFLERLEEKHGLALTLPSEAQWEYACRAGTTTAIYTGNMPIKGEHNAPALDPIAWYGGNSGQEFDLQAGADSSSWSEKQYPHTKAGTRCVKMKEANPWGLYDTLGNVWEWCQDSWHDSYKGAPTDGRAWVDEPGARRVVRGGSWGLHARFVRAACRFVYVPSNRDVILGFRCARVQ